MEAHRSVRSGQTPGLQRWDVKLWTSTRLLTLDCLVSSLCLSFLTCNMGQQIPTSLGGLQEAVLV
jgi:hypothetical protein